MNKILIKTKVKKSSALILSLVVIVALLVYAVAFISAGINQSLIVEVSRRQTGSFNLAEAGLDHAIMWLRTQAAPPIGNRVDPWGGVENLGGGSYTVTITDMGAIAGSPNIRRYRVASTGTLNNVSRVLTNYVQVDNFARFLWFTNREIFSGTNVWFWSLDVLNGPTHTNGHFNIYGTPVFRADAHSANTYIRFFNDGNNINLSQATNPPNDIPDFQQGVDFGAAAITMPAQALSLRSAAANGGIYLRCNTTVVLNSDGTMNVTNSRQGWNNRNMALPANGALFVAKNTSGCTSNLTISGTLNGRLTVGAADDVVIPNSIVYADNPRTNPASDDTMGIISEKDIMIKVILNLLK